MSPSDAATLTAPAATEAAALTAEDAYAIGVEGYHYLYPLVTMEVTRRIVTNVPPGAKPGAGPMGMFHHLRSYPTADFRDVVQPNFDTLYSVAWLDLTREPMIVSAPDTAGRYYLLPMIDLWTDVFAVPGKRTSGTAAGNYLVAPPGWAGDAPKGVELIRAPTAYVWIIGRTQTNGPKDYAAVHALQDKFALSPLSKWGGKAEAPAYKPDPSIDMKTPPLEQVNAMKAAQFFSLGAEMMALAPPHPTDWSIVARLRRIGFVPGKPFDFSKAPAHVQAALERAVPGALKVMADKVTTLAAPRNGWQASIETMGVYGNAYLKRAVIAMIGLGANQPEDAVYPMNVADADGKPLEGGQRYVLHFAKDELPPAEAFWSVTMYDAQGFQVANRLDRFAIGDRDALSFNADGSLDLYLQHDSPGSDKESNWLPSPASGRLIVTMRLYAPKAAVLDGRWAPPAVRRVP